MSISYVLNVKRQLPKSELSLVAICHSMEITWDTIIVRTHVSDYYDMHFWGKINDEIALGEFQIDIQTLSVEAESILTVAEIAIWYRNHIPNEHQLFLWTGLHYDNPIQIETTSTLNKIVKLLEQW